MAESATILIPDISGYTGFVTQTEVEHSAFILNNLLECIVQMVTDDFIVSEIEGDAVLLYKKGNPPSKKEIVEQCVKIFTSFHNMIRSFAGTPFCQCRACTGLADLTLKFVVHFGTIAEHSVARFTKASGVDMVIAHRLLKNSIPGNEYLLTTDSYLKNIPDRAEADDLEWMQSKEEYPSLGVIEFSFASLTQIKQTIPPAKERVTVAAEVDANATVSVEIEIKVPYNEAEEALVDMEKRKQYVPGFKRSEGPPSLSLGSQFICFYEDRKEIIEPRHIEVKQNEIIFEEFVTAGEVNYFAVNRYDIKANGKNSCNFIFSVSPQPGHSFNPELEHSIRHRSVAFVTKFKTYCETQLHRTAEVLS
ncbi:MAG TPA: DUF2652 domain-containing protein [Chitinophagales bacterium]|nr:DUF2652 domain-containing protein [Chitinophagales bacterium]